MKKISFIILSVLTVACSSNKYQYDASGTFEATEIIVSSEANGRILNLDIKEGDNITAGQTVGLVDTIQLSLNKARLVASRKALSSRSQDVGKQLAAIEEQITTQKREKSRIEKLVQADVTGTKTLDDIKSTITVLEKQLAAQRSVLSSGNASISGEGEALSIQCQQIDDQLAKCKIMSPISGAILVKYAEAGEVTAMGKPLFKVADTQNIILRAYITADQLTKLTLGQQVKVFSDYGGKECKSYDGTVTWIASRAEFTPKTIQTRDERANLVYAVKVSIKNDGLLKIGMYGDIKI